VVFPVEGNVQEKHVYSGLSQYAELTTFCMLVHESPDPFFRKPTRTGDSWYLKERSHNGDVGVEPAS